MKFGDIILTLIIIIIFAFLYSTSAITIKIDDEILDRSIKGRVQKLVNELNI